MSGMRPHRLAFAALLAVTLVFPALANAQENRLGRLFYSPEERAKMDQKRGVIAPVQAAGPQTSIVNGIITRNGQAPVLFIDGKEVRGAATNASAQQQLNQGVPLKSESGQTFAAKPGQIVDMSSGRAVEIYQLIPGPTEAPLKEGAPAGQGAPGKAFSALPQGTPPGGRNTSGGTQPPHAQR